MLSPSHIPTMQSALLVDWMCYLAQHKLGLAAFVLTLFIVDRFIKYWRLRQFKGPFSTGFSDLRLSWAIVSLKAYVFFGEVTEKYGKASKTTPFFSVVVDKRHYRSYRSCCP